MKSIVIAFLLPDGKVFQSITPGKNPFTPVTANNAFSLDCQAVVYLDGQRMDETAATTSQLYELLNRAAAQGYSSCSACAA